MLIFQFVYIVRKLTNNVSIFFYNKNGINKSWGRVGAGGIVAPGYDGNKRDNK